MTLYYRKTYLCICEGQQEEMYLNHVALLIKKFPQRVVKFNTIIGTPYRLKKSYENYDSAALFDYDFNDETFRDYIQLCERLNNQSRRSDKKIYHAYSNVNFDLWLILHKEEFNKQVFKNDAYVQEVRRIYGLGVTEDIKSERAIKKILDQISLEDVKKAINRASNIRNGKIDTDQMFIGSTIYYPNPDFSIHEFLKQVLTDCGEM